ncbi:NADPH:quinone reductase-like Zn-dependent oxidoreductase [Paraburkholderia sp. BL6665CI2N2]|uniref:NADP-dependent oxidoreductase n=1 Tax=Paraburkholderia sp. BL6665CI2N2 TaxID=1938806 RepID=UPI0010D1D963|nr:NADP-dependent oxidoreductase [Paraburkholderia sp. BL6665CI2N2]TDY22050.1 NADPH:quinone reductase-like Zn-dependent oxidoreductase [Paraburkholderia sp. BL6665CI2N2]
MTTSRLTMRAVQQGEWGTLDSVRVLDVPQPELLPTEVLVRVKAVGVNPIDYHTAVGRGYMNALKLPHIPGWDIAGIVEEVGFGTNRFKVGDEVFGFPHFPRAAGGYAEYVTAPARQLALKPATISFEQGAAVALAGLTAWQMLVDVAKVGAGTKVLINGAAGGVGHFAVQIAKARGAFVIAVARKEKHAFVQTLGADRVIDYTTTSVTDEVNDADVVIELAGGDTTLQMLRALRKGGLLISARKLPDTAVIRTEASNLGVKGTWFVAEPDYVALEGLAELIERGALKIEVSSILPLERAVEALKRIPEGHAVGKTVLKVN